MYYTQKITTPGLPKCLPTLVLPRPEYVYRRRSDEIRCFHLSIVVDNEFIFSNILVCKINLLHKKRDYNTWTSQVVTHPSTTQARRYLATEIGRDPVFSP